MQGQACIRAFRFLITSSTVFLIKKELRLRPTLFTAKTKVKGERSMDKG